MHFVKDVEYLGDFNLLLQFEDGSWRSIDLAGKLHGTIFEPLKDVEYFKTVKVNHDTDTIVWDNDADISPEYHLRDEHSRESRITTSCIKASR